LIGYISKLLVGVGLGQINFVTNNPNRPIYI